MQVIDRLIKLATAEVGTTERYSNNVKYNTEFYGREVSDTAKYKYHWCAVFVWWCFKHAGALDAIKLSSKWSYPSVANIWNRVKKNEITRAQDIRKGDLMFIWYKDSIPHHIGIVVEAPDASGTFKTIEGNTSPQGSSGSERNGEGVYRKLHKLGAKCRVARPDWVCVDNAHDNTSDFPLVSGWVFAKDGIQYYNGLNDGYSGYIAALQKQLNTLGYCIAQDGIFGNETDKAVKQFQEANGLEADGKVGALTWEKLFTVEASQGKFQKLEGGWLLIKPDGTCAKSEWEQVGGKWYYFDADGWMLANCTQWVGDKLYAFAPDGSCIIGEGKIVTDDSGAIVTIS